MVKARYLSIELLFAMNVSVPGFVPHKAPSKHLGHTWEDIGHWVRTALETFDLQQQPDGSRFSPITADDF